MKRTLLALAAGALFAAGTAMSPALAQVTVGDPTVTAGDLDSKSKSQAHQNVTGLDADVNTYFEASQPLKKQTLKTAPDVSAPSIVGGNPCMVSASLGVSGIGFGVAGGVGVEDRDCEVRQQVALLVNMGMSDAALLHFCLQDDGIRDTFEAMGYSCAEAEANVVPAKSGIAARVAGSEPGRGAQGAVLSASSQVSSKPATRPAPPAAPSAALTANCPDSDLLTLRRNGAAWTDYSAACRARVEAGV